MIWVEPEEKVQKMREERRDKKNKDIKRGRKIKNFRLVFEKYFFFPPHLQQVHEE